MKSRSLVPPVFMAACKPELTHELHPLIWLARRWTRSKVTAGTPPFCGAACRAWMACQAPGSTAAGFFIRGGNVLVGDEVEGDVEVVAEPPVVAEPADFIRDLDADAVARAACDRLAYRHKREYVRAIETAKMPETRARRIEKAVAMLRDQDSAGGHRAPAKTQPRAR